MYKKVQTILWVGIALLCFGCSTAIPTTLTKSWEKDVSYGGQSDVWQTQIHLDEKGDAVTIVSPAGIETLDSQGETVFRADREQFFRTYLNSTNGVEKLTDKITYLYLPHRHSLLEFNYSLTSESVTMIDIESREIDWYNGDLRWSLERYQTAVKAVSKGINNIFGQAAANTATEVLLPERFVQNMTNVIPELDAFLFKTLDGLKLISLKDGSVLWTNKEIQGGIAEMIYDPDTNSIVVVNSDDPAYKLSGLQFNKQIARIDAKNGRAIWTNQYDGNIREKLDGIGIWADRRADVRLLDDAVMLNFLNVELYDFETGDKMWQTTEGANRLIDMVAPEAQIMNLFAFPVIRNGILYRVGIENIGLGGVDVIIEAFDKETGDLVWKSDKLSKSKPVTNMEVHGDKLIVSCASSVIAFDAANGTRIWEYDGFGRAGVRHHMHKTDTGVLAASNDKIILFDPDSGNEVFTIDSNSDGLGDINDLMVTPLGIAVSGSTGFALYDANNGSITEKIETPTGGVMMSGKDRILVMPKPDYGDASYPVDGAFHIIDPDQGLLVGTLGTDGKRRAWKVDKDFKKMYVLTGNKIVMYESR